MADEDERVQPPSPAPPAFEVDVEREMRLSVVLYGGVSLAIYMNGVCQELLNLVRATSTVANDHPRRVLGELHTQYQLAAAVSADEIAGAYGVFAGIDVETELMPRRIRRRVIVDVLSGSSAGGLNALFLARALLSDGDVDTMARLLVEHADMLTLLNDDHRDDDAPWRGRTPVPGAPVMTALDVEAGPRSLLSGDRFYQLLLDTLTQQREGGTSLVEALDCYMTMTDLRGIPTGEAALAEGQVIRELQHRVVAHLVYGTPVSYGSCRNDFFGTAPGADTSPVEPFLAFIGRATAAHPAAFEPAQLRRSSSLFAWPRQAEPGQPSSPVFDPVDERWATLIRPGYTPAQLAERWFSDGGDLDNKPFTHAIDPIDNRRAEIPIERRIVYIEPDPARDGTAWGSTTQPDLVTTTVGAFTLPRREGIVDDLARIEARNRLARGLRASLRDAIERDATTTPVDRPDPDSWIVDTEVSTEQRLYEIDRARDIVETVTAWIEDLWRRLVRADAGRDHTATIRRLVAGELGAQPAHLQDTRQRRQLLVDHDIGYRLRRLNFLDRVLDEHQTGDPHRMTASLGEDTGPKSFAEARHLRRAQRATP